MTEHRLYLLSQDKILFTCGDTDEMLKHIREWMSKQRIVINLSGYSVVDDRDLSVTPMMIWLEGNK